MSTKTAKLDQTLRDFIESFSAVQAELLETHEDDEEAYTHALIETLENALEAALDDSDFDASFVAGLISACSEALENLDPEAFAEQDDVDYAMDEVEYDDDEELDEDDLDDELVDDDEDE